MLLIDARPQHHLVLLLLPLLLLSRRAAAAAAAAASAYHRHQTQQPQPPEVKQHKQQYLHKVVRVSPQSLVPTGGIVELGVILARQDRLASAGFCLFGFFV